MDYHDRPFAVAWYTNGQPVKDERLFMEVVRSNPDIEFIAVGATDSLLNADNLTAAGWQSNLARLWPNVRVVLNTSAFEGEPNFILQGLAGGCLAVGRDNAGLLALAQSYPNHVSTAKPEELPSLVQDVVSGRYPISAPDVPSSTTTVTEWLSLIRELVADD